MNDPNMAHRNQQLNRVLLVEDDIDCIDLLISTLDATAGFAADISYVSSLGEARQILCEETFDLIILDLNLEDSDGTDTVKAVSLLIENTPIIVLSAEQDPQLMLNIIRQGAQDFVSKLKMLDAEAFCRRIDFALARAEREQKVIQRAHFDQLTGLPNRYLLNDRLRAIFARAVRDSSSFSVFIVDLNGFKPVNDTFGHDAGDSLLMEIGTRLKNAFRDKDTVARIGGDEFCIVVDDSNTKSTASIRMKIQNVVRKPILWSGNEINISASVGTSEYPGDAETIEELLKLADLAMYTDKLDKEEIR